MKKLAKISLVALLVAIVIVGCVKVTVKLDLTTTSLEFTLGTTPTGQINATVNPADATINYTSENTGIATVNSSGLVTAVAAGNTRIEVQGTKDGANPSEKKYVDVTVNPQPQVEFTVETTPDPLSLVMGSGSGALSISGPSGAEYDLVAPDCVNLEYVSETEYVVVPVAAGSGEIVITGTLLGNLPKTVRIPVTVAEMPVVGVTVEPDEIEFTIVKADNDPVQLNVTTNPADAVVSYESSDNSVATVDADGLVTLAETADEGDFCVITVTGEKTGYTDGSDQVIVYVGAIHTPVVKKAEWLMKPFMIKTVGAMACEWQPTLNLQLQFFDADDDIVIGGIEIVNPNGEIVEEIALTENFYLPTTYVIDVADLDDELGELVGGTYEVNIGVIDADGLTAGTTLFFQVMADPFEVAGVGFADDSAVQYDGSCVVITENPILELDIWFDSKVSVNVALYNSLGLVDEMDFDLYANEWGLYTEELDLSDMVPYMDGTAYLVVTVDVPETCCIYPVVLEVCDGIYFDKTPELECAVEGSPCGDVPCEICEGYTLVGMLSNLLFEDLDFISDVELNINGLVTIDSGFVFTKEDYGFEIEFEMPCEEFGVFLNPTGNTPFTWTVTTVTGEVATATCEYELDCVPPTFSFTPDTCYNYEELEALNWGIPIAVVVTDNNSAGELKDVFAPWLEDDGGIATLDYDADFPTGVVPYGYTIEATLVIDKAAVLAAGEGDVVLGVSAEDIVCNTGSDSFDFHIDVEAPIVYFGQACGDSYDCIIPCYSEDSMLQWFIIEENVGTIELEVSDGYLNGVEGQTSVTIDATNVDDQMLWSFPEICGTISATMTVTDACGNETVEAIEAEIDNIPPSIEVFETGIVDECDSSTTTLLWCVSEECSTATVYIWINEGFLEDYGAGIVEEVISFPFDMIGYYSPLYGTLYKSTYASVDADEVVWNFSGAMKCETLKAIIVAGDSCAFKDYACEDFENCGIFEEIEAIVPGTIEFVEDIVELLLPVIFGGTDPESIIDYITLYNMIKEYVEKNEDLIEEYADMFANITLEDVASLLEALLNDNNFDVEYLENDTIIHNAEWDAWISVYCPSLIDLPLGLEDNCGTQRFEIAWEIGPMIDSLGCINPENVWIVTNYPYVPCGVDVPAVEGEYEYPVLELLERNIANYESPFADNVYVDYVGYPSLFGRAVSEVVDALLDMDIEVEPDYTWLEGFLYFCTPKLDCETFTATLMYKDSCWEEGYEIPAIPSSVQIDNVRPELSVDVTDPTCGATDIFFTVTATDGSYFYESTIPGTITTSAGTVTPFNTGTMNPNVFIQTYQWQLPDLNCEDVTLTATVDNICCEDPQMYCCDLDLSAVWSKTFTIDNVMPEGEATITGENVSYCGDKVAVTATEVTIEWAIEGADSVEVDVSDGDLSELVALFDGETYPSTTGTIIWDLTGVTDKEVYATVTGIDNCGNCIQEIVAATLSAYVDNTAPVITIELDGDVDTCESTSATLVVTVTDPNLVCNELCSTPYHVGNVTTNIGTLTEDEIWAECGCGGAVTFKTLWNFGTVDGATLTAQVVAWDLLGNTATETFTDGYVDNAAPVINSFNISTPGATVLQFCWNATDTDFSNMTIDYSVDGGDIEKEIYLDPTACATVEIPVWASIVATATAFDAQPCCHETESATVLYNLP